MLKAGLYYRFLYAASERGCYPPRPGAVARTFPGGLQLCMYYSERRSNGLQGAAAKVDLVAALDAIRAEEG